jgi:hypothetical protein
MFQRIMPERGATSGTLSVLQRQATSPARATNSLNERHLKVLELRLVSFLE